MFLLNVGSKWTLATELESVRGAVFLASSNSGVRFTRRTSPDLGRIIIDPQLYLSNLDVKACSKVCGRLATHPWFMVDGVPEFDGALSVTTWQKVVNTAASENWTGEPPQGEQVRQSCLAAIRAQVEFGCTHIILPVPMLDEREDAGGLLAEWLDAGLEAANELEVGQPLLATVAIAQPTLNKEAFEPGGFLEAIVDQVTARVGLGGVYIVIGLFSAALHPFETQQPALKAYAHLSHAFRESRFETVMVNFADVFGLVCVAAGATDLATGESQTRRRLCMNAFRDQGGGVAVPHFYSHAALAEFATETDLNPIIKARLVRRIIDETPYSEELFETLANTGTAADSPGWAEGQNNVGLAQRHFITRLALEGEAFRVVTRKKRSVAIRDALDEAEATELLLTKRLGRRVGRYAPAKAWRDVLDDF